MSVFYKYNEHFITLTGQTYPHRSAIKNIGARFQWGDKTWRVPFSPETLDKVDKLCVDLGGKLLENDLENQDDLDTEGQIAQEDSYRISDVLNLVEGVIHKSFSKPIWVIGELQNIQQKSGKSVFFHLAEEDEKGSAGNTMTLSAIIWPEILKSLNKRLKPDKLFDIIQDGLNVRLLCQVQFYKGRGNISLVVHDIDPRFTKGSLALAREKLLADLRKNNLIDANKKCQLTPFPFKVGLISAENSRAESDFLDQLKVGNFPGEIMYCTAAMQGDQAPLDVERAIKILIKKNCDLIVLTRGGGSAADLRWFDTEKIALAIAKSKVPIIAAIGHHDDTCVAEEVCFKRQKTPTAAADFVLSCFQNVVELMEVAVKRFSYSLDQAYSLLSEKQNQLSERIKSATIEAIVTNFNALQNVSFKLERNCLNSLSIHTDCVKKYEAELPLQTKAALIQKLQKINDISEKQQWSIERKFEHTEKTLNQKEQEIKQADPSPWLNKGWTQLRAIDGKKILRAKKVQKGDHLKASLLDGVLHLTVEDRTIKDKKNED